MDLYHLYAEPEALTRQPKEKSSGVITLKDEPEFADAIDCMLSYFYRAGYDASRYDTSTPLLHARVAIIADKYDCASLYKLAETSLASSIGTAEIGDWVAIAALIYDYTTTELPAHMELRNLVVHAVPGHPDISESFFRNESVEELLRSTADLGADLLLSRVQKLMPKNARQARQYIFTCDYCRYAHAGSSNCPIVINDEYASVQTCPQCGKSGGTTKKNVKSVQRVGWARARPCPSCNGMHTSTLQEFDIEDLTPVST